MKRAFNFVAALGGRASGGSGPVKFGEELLASDSETQVFSIEVRIFLKKDNRFYILADHPLSPE